MRNEIRVLGSTMEFMGKQLKVIEGGFGEGKRVLTAHQIAEIHSMEVKEVNRLTYENLDEFEDGVDILNLLRVGTTHSEINILFNVNLPNNTKNFYIYSEQGYMALVGLMRNDDAREIRKKIRREYFTMINKASNVIKSIELIEFKGNIDNLVYSKNGKPITTSRIISEYTNKEHKHILIDIREEIEKLKNISPNLSQSIINDFNEIIYLDTYGREQVEYELGEMATMQVLLKYSTEYRAKFILTFQNMKETLMNMFKVKVLEEVLPQDNRLRQYVYIIENQDNGAIKIGVAQNVEKRLKQLQTGSVSELELIYRSLLCSNAFEVENFMHEKFKDKHIRGEWFNLDKTVVINELEKQKFVLNSNFSAYLKTSDDFYF